MSEITRVADQLARAFDGPAWHGPSLNEILAGVTASAALARPIPGCHSIWELVLHIASWEDTVARRLRGEQIEDPVEGNFPQQPPNAEATEQAWAALRDKANERHAMLVEQVKSLTEDNYFLMVTGDEGRSYRAWFMIHGAVSHVLYHAGQIMLLKKAIEAKP